MSGDQKYGCTLLGLQGGSAVHGCIWCLAPRCTWSSLNLNNLNLRTIESIEKAAEKVITAGFNNLSYKKWCAVRQKHSNVDHRPLITEIPIKMFPPGPTHTLICLINTALKLADKYEGKQYVFAFVISNQWNFLGLEIMLLLFRFRSTIQRKSMRVINADILSHILNLKNVLIMDHLRH